MRSSKVVKKYEEAVVINVEGAVALMTRSCSVVERHW